MADEGTIEIGSTTLDTPIGYTHHPLKLQSDERAMDGTLLTTRIATPEDQPKSKYRFEVFGIENSKMYAMKAEAVHIGNLDYIDNIQIVEVLTGDAAEDTFYTQRRMSGATPIPTITLGGVAKNVTINPAINPGAGDVYAQADIAGRARFIFGDIPPAVSNNIIIRYEPKYYIRIPEDGFRYVGMIANVASFLLICKEV